MMLWASTPSWLSAAGIVWDIAGAFALARGYFFMTEAQAKSQSGTYWGASIPAMRAISETRLETKFGLLQLLSVRSKKG